MDSGKRDRAAALLIEARRANAPIDGLPAECRPASVEGGYAIQDAVTAKVGLKVIGRKIGCTAVAQQKFLGVEEPFLGRMFAETSHKSGVSLPGNRFAMRGIEGEFAFRLSKGLPARATPYSRDEVAAVAELHPAIEIVCTRFQDWRGPNVGAPSIVADNGAHGAFIEGPAAQGWRGLDLAKHRMTLTVDGKQIAEGTGSEVLGHPLEALAWAANACAKRGHPLKAGDIVSTGTCVGFHPVGPGAHVLVDLDSLGKVELRFT
jgi:2-keto-4-pentenoate hydratase